ncbi:hypothetical protein BDV12DRAFT_125777 [Aspergillus spectabilis]
MDADPSASRDPRLNRPSLPPSRLSQHEIQQRPPSDPLQLSAADARNDVSGDQFIRGIGELVQAAVLEATHKSERERIQNRRSNTDSVLRKAKNSAFPSTVEFFKQTQTDEDRVLTNINAKIKHHESQYQRLIDDLGNKWAASTNSKASKSDDKVPQLQQDLKVANDKIAALHRDVENLLGKNQSLQDQLSNQQRGFAGYTNLLALLQNKVDGFSTLKKDMEDLSTLKKGMEDLSTLKKGMEELPALKESVDELSNLKKNIDELFPLKKGTDDVSALNRNTDELKKYMGELSSFKTDVSDVSKRLKLLEERTPQPPEGTTSQTSKTLNELSKQYKLLEQKTTEWGEKVVSLSSTYQRISQLPSQVDQTLKSHQQRLEQLTNGHAANPKLDKDVLSLKSRLDELQDIQSTKDDLVFADMEEIKKILDVAQKNQKELSESVKQLSTAIPAEPVDPKLAALYGDVQNLVEPLNIALRSLEARYNNMTTEAVVQHMVVAMQEMYPSAEQILKSMTAQKNYLDEELPPLKSKIQQLEIHANASTMFQREIESIKAEQKRLSLSFGAFLERYSKFSPEEYHGLQSHVKSLAENQGHMEVVFRNQTAEEVRGIQSILKTLADKQSNLESIYQYQTAEELRAIQSSLKSLAEKQSHMESAHQTQTSEEFRGMQSNLKCLAEMQSKMESVYQNHTADRESLQDLLRKHESLDKRVTSLNDSYEKLNSEYAQPKSGFAMEENRRALERDFGELEKGSQQSKEKLSLRRIQASAAASDSGSSQREATPKTGQLPPPPKPTRIDTSISTNSKRRHPSSYSDDEDTPGATPSSIRSPALTASSTVNSADIKKKKKKKKRKRELEGPIQIDD